MKKHIIRFVFVISMLIGTTLCVANVPPQNNESLTALQLSQLELTEGNIEEIDDSFLWVGEPKVRAIANQPTFPIAALEFTYEGTTEVTIPLDSGELREQLGLKLLAQDSCNVVYVMWRIQPESGLVVSVKSNPGETDDEQCGNDGYTTITPRSYVAPPALSPGDTHTLSAKIMSRVLLVYIDGNLVWWGTLPPEILKFTGPSGLRTDNSQLSFKFLAELRPAM